MFPINPGEFGASAMALHHGRSPPAAGRCLEFPLESFQPSDGDPTNKNRTYPFDRVFAKETLAFLSIEPAVPNVLRGIRKLVWKAYFGRVEFKVRFWLITVLPLILFCS